MRPTPNDEHERGLWRAGYRLVAGVDEVGRGPLAGPVVAGAVVLAPFRAYDWLPHVDDSKRLTPLQRERLSERIMCDALATGIGIVPAAYVDARGIVPATRAAVAEAVRGLGVPAEFLLLDAFTMPHIDLNQIALTKGDARSASIACASIVAKVARDALMVSLDDAFPGYGFRRHKGYGSAEHLAALHALGPCSEHRQSFAPVRTLALS